MFAETSKSTSALPSATLIVRSVTPRFNRPLIVALAAFALVVMFPLTVRVPLPVAMLPVVITSPPMVSDRLPLARFQKPSEPIVTVAVSAIWLSAPCVTMSLLAAPTPKPIVRSPGIALTPLLFNVSVPAPTVVIPV